MNAVLERIDQSTLRTLLVMLVLCVTVMMFSYFVWPQFKHYREQVKVGDVLENVVNDRGDIANQLAEREQQVDVLSKKLHGDMANMPLQQMESYIIGQLQKISWATDIKLLGVRPTEGKKYRMYQEILFNVDLSGRYFDLFEWLRKVSQELGFVVVKKYDIAGSGRIDAEDLNIKLTIVSYRAD